MIDYTKVRGVLRGKVVSATGFPAASNRAWEGRSFKPTPGVGYVRENMLLAPESSRPASVGRNALIRTQGIYQLTLCWPGDQGTDAVDTVALAILNILAPGTPLTSGATKVHIRTASRATANQDGDRIEVPLSFNWYSDTINPI